jgi:hypothetical protein
MAIDPDEIRDEFSQASAGYLMASADLLSKIEADLLPLVCHGVLLTRDALNELREILVVENRGGRMWAWRRRNAIRDKASIRELGIYAAVRWGMDHGLAWTFGQRPLKFMRRNVAAMGE